MAALAQERKKAEFDVRQMTHFLHGGKENTQLKEYIYKMVASDPVLYDPETVLDLTRRETRER